MTPTIRPIRFSALKTLDPLHEEEERSENHDRQPDIDEVEHGALLGFPEVIVRLYAGLTDSVKPRERRKSPVQAGPMRGAMRS